VGVELLACCIKCQGKQWLAENRDKENAEDQEAHRPVQPEIAHALVARRDRHAIARMVRFNLFAWRF
jgi:hypothetical protein